MIGEPVKGEVCLRMVYGTHQLAKLLSECAAQIKQFLTMFCTVEHLSITRGICDAQFNEGKLSDASVRKL